VTSAGDSPRFPKESAMREDERGKWTKLVADFESTDLSQREFAQERGISLSNLRYWIYRLRKDSRPLVTGSAERSGQVPERVPTMAASRLLPVRVVASAAKRRSAMAAGRDGDGHLELVLPSGARVRFPVGTDLKYLEALAAAL
jgi:transposase